MCATHLVCGQLRGQQRHNLVLANATVGFPSQPVERLAKAGQPFITMIGLKLAPAFGCKQQV
jgi:hypothetical protein